MRCIIFSLLIVMVSTISGVFCRVGFQGTEQEWGYVTVREKAHMFWWLFYTSATANYTEKPLIIWLQGGPGGSGTGVGNFEELGPFDLELKPRNTSWVNYANVLFVDNPVGTGFSYVDDFSALASTNQQVAQDFLELMKSFYAQLPEFSKVPLYIFCESYGGKMTAEIALVLNQAIQNGTLKANLTAIGLGDSWVAPYDIVAGWPQYLWNVGAIDSVQQESMGNSVAYLKNVIDNELWEEATDIWSQIESRVQEYAIDIDFYNILTKVEALQLPNKSTSRNRNNLSILRKIYKPILHKTYDIEDIMNTYVKKALNLNSTWQMLSDEVFEGLYNEFMKPATDVVEKLLNETNVHVVIYNGQLDLICATPGVIKYVENLKWNNSLAWNNSPRAGFYVNFYYEGYVRNYDRLTFYWVNRAGHRVPSDNPSAMQYILRKTTKNFEV